MVEAFAGKEGEEVRVYDSFYLFSFLNLFSFVFVCDSLFEGALWLRVMWRQWRGR